MVREIQAEDFAACVRLAEIAVGGYCKEYRDHVLSETLRREFIESIADELYDAVSVNDHIDFDKHNLYDNLDYFIENYTDGPCSEEVKQLRGDEDGDEEAA